MKSPVALTLALVLLTLVPGLQTQGAPSQSPVSRERTQAAYVLGLGRAPTDGEVAADDSTESLAGRLTRLQGKLQQDRELAMAVATKAWRDALGSEPDARAIAGATNDASIYATLVQRHLQRLAAQPDEYRAVIDRAYHRAVKRAAYDIEHEYWSRHEVMPFMLLVACIENWAVRNQPGLMSTTGAPSISSRSAFLTTARLSPAVAREASEALGLRPAADEAMAAARNHCVLAPGAAGIVSIGGIHFVATGVAVDEAAN